MILFTVFRKMILFTVLMKMQSFGLMYLSVETIRIFFKHTLTSQLVLPRKFGSLYVFSCALSLPSLEEDDPVKYALRANAG